MRIACVLVGAAITGCGGSPAPLHPTPPPPPPPREVSCVQVREHVEPLLAPTYGKDPDALRRIAHAFTKRCLEDAWSVDVRICLADTHVLADDQPCLLRLPAAHQTAFATAVAAAATDPRAVPPGGLPPSCLKFKAAVERLVACDRLPQAARDGMRDGFEATWKAWQELSDEDKRALDDGCRSGVTSTEDNLLQFGCT